MSPERAGKIETLLHSTLELPVWDRSAYITDACAGDAALEREVRSQLDAVSRIGETVSHYRIVEKLGEGGMGVVYKAEDLRLRRSVALKFLLHNAGKDPRATERFEREARSASALNHPNICTIYEVEEHRGLPVIVMELLEGQSLRQRIRAGNIGLEELTDFGIQTADALEAAHARGIIHRDIKPANLFITTRGDAKILDFGMAKTNPVSPAALPDRPTLTIEDALTEAGSAVGTVSHMSPEQIRGLPADTRTDLFSFGVVLYEMATGQLPFRGDSTGAVFDAILNRTPVAPVRLNSDLPPEFERIVARCLEKDRTLRYQHASEICTDLRRLKRDSNAAPLPSKADHPASAARARKWLLPVAAALAVAATGGAGYFYSHRVPKLTDRDTIVLSDFDNKTGDALFDGTLRQGLTVQLQQSPFLSLISDDRIQSTLHRMEKPADSRLTPALAREICERTGGMAFLEGSIAPLGSEYVLGLRGKNCATGDVLDEEQSSPVRKEDVLKALSQIAGDFRRKVGESLASVTRHNIPLAEATTSSLEALKAFSQALQVSGPEDASRVSFLKRALNIDPQFATAHAWLGMTYMEAGETALAAQSFTEALRLRDRTSEAERFLIEAIYEIQVTGDLEKAEQTCIEWEQTYPRALELHGFRAAMIYLVFGRYQDALDQASKALALDPRFGIGYYQTAFLYANLEQKEKSDEELKRAAALGLDLPEYLVQRYINAFLRDDAAGMSAAALMSQSRREVDDVIAMEQSMTLAYHGRVAEARRYSQHALELANQRSQFDRAAVWEAVSAIREGFLGNKTEARQRALSSLSLSKARDSQYGAAVSLTLASDLDKARSLTQDLQTRFPEDTAVKRSYAPTLRALIALQNGGMGSGPQDAVNLLEYARIYDLGSPPSTGLVVYGALYPVYARGLAYLELGKGTDAALEFRRVLDHPGLITNDPIGALAHWRLGQALALSGHTAEASAAYRDFFKLWEHADPDVPVLIAAKAQFAKLSATVVPPK